MKNTQAGPGGVGRGRHEMRSYFEHRGHEIVLVASMFSGKERVYVDDALVSESRNWRFRNVHAFHAGDVAYELEARIQKRLKHVFAGVADVCLRADGEVIDRDRINALRQFVANGKPLTWKRWLLVLSQFFAGGLVVGFAVGYLVVGKLF